VTKNIAITVINLVTPKARAKHEHLFNEPASGAILQMSPSDPLDQTGLTQLDKNLNKD
jgi:hypothetical protein